MDERESLNGLDALFRRWPALLGFSVQDAHDTTSEREWVNLDNGLVLADVGLDDWIAHEQKLELLADMAQSLLQLIDERSEARALLRGRTFARMLH